MATGLIVGESLFGVLLAGVIAATGSETPLAIVGDDFQTVANWLGVAAFVVVILGLYRWVQQRAAAQTTAP